MNETSIDNKAWAQQVREIKIRELKDLIKSVKKTDPDRIPELKKKLKIIETK